MPVFMLLVLSLVVAEVSDEAEDEEEEEEESCRRLRPPRTALRALDLTMSRLPPSAKLGTARLTERMKCCCSAAALMAAVPPALPVNEEEAASAW